MIKESKLPTFTHHYRTVLIYWLLTSSTCLYIYIDRRSRQFPIGTPAPIVDTTDSRHVQWVEIVQRWAYLGMVRWTDRQWSVNWFSRKKMCLNFHSYYSLLKIRQTSYSSIFSLTLSRFVDDSVGCSISTSSSSWAAHRVGRKKCREKEERFKRPYILGHKHLRD